MFDAGPLATLLVFFFFFFHRVLPTPHILFVLSSIIWLYFPRSFPSSYLTNGVILNLLLPPPCSPSREWATILYWRTGGSKDVLLPTTAELLRMRAGKGVRSKGERQTDAARSRCIEWNSMDRAVSNPYCFYVLPSHPIPSPPFFLSFHPPFTSPYRYFHPTYFFPYIFTHLKNSASFHALCSSQTDTRYCVPYTYLVT